MTKRLELSVILGTNCFHDTGSARRYYAAYGCDSNEVARKIREAEITIGRPNVMSNERAVLDSDGRYLIHVYRETFDD